jgi:hypothetical protein
MVIFLPVVGRSPPLPNTTQLNQPEHCDQWADSVRVSFDDSKANVSAPAVHSQTVQQPVKPSVRPNFRNVELQKVL